MLTIWCTMYSQFASPDYTVDDRLANQVNMYFLRIPIRCTHACTANCVCVYLVSKMSHGHKSTFCDLTFII